MGLNLNLRINVTRLSSADFVISLEGRLAKDLVQCSRPYVVWVEEAMAIEPPGVRILILRL